MPQVERSLVVDRSSSSSFAFACHSVAVFALVGLFSGVSATVAVPAHWNSFAQGIGSLSWKRFMRYLKISCMVSSFRMGHRIEIGTDV